MISKVDDIRSSLHILAKEKGAEVKFRPFNVIFMENEVTSYIFE